MNNFGMSNFRQVHRMQAASAGRIALKVCDLSPLHIATYYDDLFRGLQRRGTIVGAFVSPEMALNHGKYEMRSRQGPEIAREAYACLRRHCSTTS